MLPAVDCQSFAGGFTLGVVQAGFELVGKREDQVGFGVPNLLANRHLLGYNWQPQNSPPEEWEAIDVPFVFGNPPCAGFSVAAPFSNRVRGIDAKQNLCMWHFIQYAAKCRPLVAVFESVRSAYTIGHPLMTALRDELENLTGLRYQLYHVMHNAYHLGGVSRRPRYFWVASQIPFGLEPLDPVYPRVLADAWDDLEGMPLTWESQPYKRLPTEWSSLLRNNDNVVDGHAMENGHPKPRLADLLVASREINAWPEGGKIFDVALRMHENGNLPDSWGDQIKKYLMTDCKYISAFNPMRWYMDRPGRVIIGGATSLVVHPREDRLITHREAARLMGFPDNWRIWPLRNDKKLGLYWGKGITVMCGKWIGTHVHNALTGNHGGITGELVADREYLLDMSSPVMVSSKR